MDLQKCLSDSSERVNSIGKISKLAAADIWIGTTRFQTDTEQAAVNMNNSSMFGHSGGTQLLFGNQSGNLSRIERIEPEPPRAAPPRAAPQPPAPSGHTAGHRGMRTSHTATRGGNPFATGSIQIWQFFGSTETGFRLRSSGPVLRPLVCTGE